MAARKKHNVTPKKDTQKGEMLRIRLTAEQKIAFDAAAQRLGIGLSAFARMSMIERARTEGIEVKV
jgi:antitoxin component of RelBE/YafQ-DinJ toxin-antitoxin module